MQTNNKMREAIDYLCERMADMDATFDPSEVECLRAALAVPATSEKSSAVGNAAAMREALSEIVLLTVKAGRSISCDVACGIIASKAKHALKQPPRNCDKFATLPDALAAWRDVDPREAGTFDLWLFDTAQGRRREVKPTCKTCAHFKCDTCCGNGEPLGSFGSCSLRAYYAACEIDDWCKHYDIAEWAEKAEGGAK